jgi:hypothetical protein
VVEVEEFNAVGPGKRLVAMPTKALGSRPRRGPFSDGNRSLVSLPHKVEDGTNSIHVRDRQGLVGHHEIGLHQDMPRGGEIDVGGDVLQRVEGVSVAVIAPDESDLAIGH